MHIVYKESFVPTSIEIHEKKILTRLERMHK